MTRRIVPFPGRLHYREHCTVPRRRGGGRIPEAYRVALRQKRTAEEAERDRAFVTSLLEEKSLDAFIKRLAGDAKEPSPIRTRSAPAYSLLTAGLCAMDKEVPARLEKLWIIILGRNRNGTAVWCDGNICSENLQAYRLIFDAVDKSGKEWQALHDIRAKFSVKAYRASGIQNRHGHSNTLLSWSARGYASPNAFKLAEPEEFAKYVALRAKCGRIPSWMRTRK